MPYSSKEVRIVEPDEFQEEVERLRGMKEGLVCRRASEPEGYANGLTNTLQAEGIVEDGIEPEELFDEVIYRVASSGRRDVILPFVDKPPADFEQLSNWRLTSPFKWISDYINQEDVEV